MKHIKVEQAGGVFRITLTREEKRNAFHPEMIQELTKAFHQAAKSKERVVVLSGAGESFCAGGDLDWMKSIVKFSDKENLKDSEQLFDMFEAARVCPLPILGRAHGHAMGGGLGLLAVCDIVAAEAKTQFCFSEVKIGLVPAVISSFCLAKMLPSRARALMLTARIFSAEEALQSGLIHFQGDAAAVDAYLEKNIGFILKAGPEAVRETKKLLLFLSENPPGKYRKHSTKVIAKRRASKEGQAGLKSFFEKKPAPWV
jgi:methylglutaconyl-CoA hydratase